jgi:hypothetical protein
MSLRHIAAIYALAWSAVALGLPRHATLVSRQNASTTHYDFVIAGGGISGLTVADRLTEDPNGMPTSLPTLGTLECHPLDHIGHSRIAKRTHD